VLTLWHLSGEVCIGSRKFKRDNRVLPETLRHSRIRLIVETGRASGHHQQKNVIIPFALIAMA
jgi:hypothetical protein